MEKRAELKLTMAEFKKKVEGIGDQSQDISEKSTELVNGRSWMAVGKAVMLKGKR